MDGAVGCTQSRYGGACFNLSFPVGMPDQDSPSKDKPVDIDLSELRILMAEDEATLRLLTERMLTKRGAQINCFENGRLALDAFQTASYNLVLTDLMMPVMSGLELITNIRTQNGDIPIIAVTAATLGSETNELLAAGADAVVAKPITPAALMKILADLRGRRPVVTEP